MAELTFKVHVSIDGFVARPDGDLTWLDAGFEHEGLAAWEVGVVGRLKRDSTDADRSTGLTGVPQ